MKDLFFISLILLLLSSCSSDRTEPLKSLDLLKYGVPVTILAPDSPEVKTMDLIVQKDITIRKGNDYFVQIFMSDAVTTDVSKVLKEQMEQTKTNPYFSKFLTEDAHGYIYELQVDSSATTYGFKFVKIQGDNEFVFQTGLSGLFNEEQVRRMYQAVQNKQ